MKTALTIAGSDSSGGAGIQADLKAMTMNGVFAMSAITALTAQNTTGVSGIFEVSPEFLAQQIDAVFTDIRPCAVKIGMVSSARLIETIAERLRFYKAEHIVVDPVMVATSGSDLIASDAVRTLRRELFPLAEVITPNRHEAEVLSGLHISGRADMSAAARAIAADCGCAVLLKGGHSDTDADDLLTFPDGTEIWFPGKRIANPNTHGLHSVQCHCGQPCQRVCAGRSYRPGQGLPDRRAERAARFGPRLRPAGPHSGRRRGRKLDARRPGRCS